MDADPDNIQIARTFFGHQLTGDSNRVQIRQARVTRDNINELISGAGLTGEIDLLSIDIDGNDYWIWEAIQVIEPRVVVIEYNAAFGAHRAVTIPYDPEFVRMNESTQFYYGASLEALTILGEKKGYALVGCNEAGVNAFFVKKEDLKTPLRGHTAQEAFRQQLKLLYGLSAEDLVSTIEQFSLQTIR